MCHEHRLCVPDLWLPSGCCCCPACLHICQTCLKHCTGQIGDSYPGGTPFSASHAPGLHCLIHLSWNSWMHSVDVVCVTSSVVLLTIHLLLSVQLCRAWQSSMQLCPCCPAHTVRLHHRPPWARRWPMLPTGLLGRDIRYIGASAMPSNCCSFSLSCPSSSHLLTQLDSTVD